jgi:hypothetical protein
MWAPERNHRTRRWTSLACCLHHDGLALRCSVVRKFDLVAQQSSRIFIGFDSEEVGIDVERRSMVVTVENTQGIAEGVTGGPHHESAIVFRRHLMFTAIRIHSMRQYDAMLECGLQCVFVMINFMFWFGLNPASEHAAPKICWRSFPRYQLHPILKHCCNAVLNRGEW